MITKFVMGNAKGWLNVRYVDNDSTYPPLPNYLRIEYHGTADGRDSFTVLEGKPLARGATVRRREDGISYLQEGKPWLPPGRIVYATETGQLWYGPYGPVAVTTDPDNPQPYGQFDLEIPDKVHAMGAHYEDQSIYAKSWFRVGHSGDRYLHTESRSAGCTTVTDVASWNSIYHYLIRRRVGDQKSVGTMRVVRFSSERFFPSFVSNSISRLIKNEEVF